ncbi:MAG: archease [Candidatus Bilamarchaeaceae archaeon]
MGGKWRVLEHTSDLFIEAEGKDLKEAVENLCLGMFESVRNPRAKGKGKITIEGRGEVFEDALVNFLSAVIAEADGSGFSPVSAEVMELGEKKIVAKVYGEKIPPANTIKAVTYHLLKVEMGERRATLRVLFDI